MHPGHVSSGSRSDRGPRFRSGHGVVTLTPQQARYLEAYMELGTGRAAASWLGVSLSHFKNTMAEVHQALGVRKTTQAALLWDRRNCICGRR